MSREQEKVLPRVHVSMPVFFYDLPNADPDVNCSIAKNYWDHLDRINKSDNNRGLLPSYVGLGIGLINGGCDIAKGIMGMKGNSTHPGRFLDVNVNNYTNNSIVLYKVERGNVFQSQNIAIPADGSGSLSIINSNFQRDNGPKLYFCMDYGKGTVSFVVQLGSTTNDNTIGSGQIRIRQVGSINSFIWDPTEDENGSSNQPNTLLKTPAFQCIVEAWNAMEPYCSFYIVCPPVSDSSAALNITFV